MTVTNIDCPADMYPYKCPYPMSPTRIVIHNTANDASAYNEIRYMQSNKNEVSFHYAVDDAGAVRGLPLDRNAWHAGDGGSGTGNRQGIAIEICYSKSGGDRFVKSVRNGASLTYDLLRTYGWDLTRVTKHQDYSGKYCPHRILDEYGFSLFKDLVEAQGISDAGDAIDRIGRLGVIDAAYWRRHYREVKYLDLLFLRAAKAIIKKGRTCANLSKALDALTGAGVVNTRSYWEKNYHKEKYLELLLKKLGGSV